MNDELLMQLIKGEPVTDAILEHALFEMCDEYHSSCDSACLIQQLGLKGDLPGECPFFKDGAKMLQQLRAIAKANEKPPRDGTVAALRKWLEPKNGDDTLWIRETLSRGGHDYKLGPLPEFPPMGVTIYIERDHSMDRPKKAKKTE